MMLHIKVLFNKNKKKNYLVFPKHSEPWSCNISQYNDNRYSPCYDQRLINKREDSTLNNSIPDGASNELTKKITRQLHITINNEMCRKNWPI